MILFVMLLAGSMLGATLSLGTGPTIEVSNFSAGTSEFSVQVSQPGYNFAGVKIQPLAPGLDLVLNSATVNGNVATGFSVGSLDGAKYIAPDSATLLLPNFAVGTVVFNLTATGAVEGQSPSQLFMVFLQNQNSYGFTAYNTADSPEPATWALAGAVLLVLVALGKKPS
ncbi:MAG: hypothetical protein JNN11_02135 [Candidatus Doudnabacteria bacterium]|nr:hypothetical protein [Candidatus Doudnabacteria bacterium]